MSAADELHWPAPRLAFWQAYSPMVKCDLSSAALLTAEGAVLVDPVMLRPAAFAELREKAPIAAIVLTNGNHARAAEHFRRETGARIFAPAGADGLEVTPDVIFAPGETLPGGIESVPLPAAGPGEVALIAGDVVCIGDALIHLTSHGFSLLPDRYCRDARALRDELRKLLSYRIRIMTFAHGVPIVVNAKHRLAGLLE